MISCTTFRETLVPGTDDALVLEHLRHCDACLDFAAGVDPDLVFRSIGGGELVPPGGVDAFTADVMREVRLRETEHTVETRRTTPWWQRAAIAATVAVGILGATFGYRLQHTTATSAPIAAMHPAAAAILPQSNLATRPVVEKYESKGATIVEVPTDATDVAVVMIIDDKLPSDL